MSAYMRGIAPFLGVGTVDRRSAVRRVLADTGVPSDLASVCDMLYQREEREFHYAAWDVCSTPRVVRTLTSHDLPWLEPFIVRQPWWDTVDYLVPRVIGVVLRSSPHLLGDHVRAWIASGELWYQRAALVVQLGWKDATQFDVLAEAILATAGSKEFFLRKGAGWALREYAYTDIDVVYEFVDRNKHLLSGLTVREALKHRENVR